MFNSTIFTSRGQLDMPLLPLDPRRIQFTPIFRIIHTIIAFCCDPVKQPEPGGLPPSGLAPYEFDPGPADARYR